MRTRIIYLEDLGSRFLRNDDIYHSTWHNISEITYIYAIILFRDMHISYGIEFYFTIQTR
jgi:hypothetical protein